MKELKLGLALGAGGTKGAAHVGVMKVLSDAGIRIDAIAGTSIGAIYGGAFAAGHTADFMAEGIATCPNRDVINFFRHRLKLRHDNRLSRRFYDALAGHQIEHLPIPFAVTASDIVSHRPVIIDRGPLLDAIEASIAIPFIARPVAHQGSYFVDGGFWDAAPVGAAVHLGADVVLAIELGQPYTLPESLRSPASWAAARLARIGKHRTAAGLAFSIRALTEPMVPGRTASLVLRPPVARYSSNSPFGMKACLEAGMTAAREALPAIRALLAGEPLPVVAIEAAGAQMEPRMAPEAAT